MTLCIGRSDLLRVLDVHACLDRLWDGFTAPTAGIANRRVRTELPGSAGTAAVLMPGLLPGVTAYTVRTDAVFPRARPALRGVVFLHDLSSGELLALLDSATLTTWRTSLAAALGTHSLARFDAEVLGIIGCGTQAGLFTRGLTRLRPISGMIVADAERQRAGEFADWCATEFGLAVRVADSAAAVAAEADIVLTATWSREPFLRRADARPGAHYTSLGTDDPGIRELSDGLFRMARVIVDDAEFAATTDAVPSTALVHGTLHEVLTGTVAAREGEADITVYVPAGLPWQDLALAWLAYRGARDAGAGTEFDFLA
ncbi:ornithine cyclodeaminase family protein [Allosalinactinospora lopnorensis]|uniref:ornithine cyclodeaminase family protein n=1 Tax=Allosalinactinospora lopnorensis TaxID=1352348 RepID=UPI000623D8B7|nr:ornithine cyclodeaminase family protein [Allosalinactinospora lopnorensis]